MGINSKPFRIWGALFSVVLLALLTALGPAAAGAESDQSRSAPKASISGEVRVPAGHDLSDVVVRIVDTEGRLDSVAEVDSAGQWQITDLEPRTYKVQFDSISGSLESQWWDSAGDFSDATSLLLGDGGEAVNISAEMLVADLGPAPKQLGAPHQDDDAPADPFPSNVSDVVATPALDPAGGGAQTEIAAAAPPAGRASISGTVKVPNGESVLSVEVYAYAEDGNSYRGDISADGTYRINRLPAGTYDVLFSVDRYGTANMVSQWWEGKHNRPSKTTIKLAIGENRTDVDATMVEGGVITGEIAVPDGQRQLDVTVYVYGADGGDYSGLVSEDGTYRVVGMPTGNYKVFFSVDARSNSEMLSQWWGGVSDWADAAVIDLEVGETRVGVDATMANGAVIAGKVTVPAGEDPRDVDVYAHAENGMFYWGEILADGTYRVGRLPAGTYTVEFRVWSGTSNLVSQWWDGVCEKSDATEISLAEGANKLGVSAEVGSACPSRFVKAGKVSIAGTARVGNTLTAKPGTWGPGKVDLAYRWFADGKSIPRATSPTYTPGPTHLGKKISVEVTGNRSGYAPVSAMSSQTANVKRGILAKGTVSVAGAHQVGFTLTARPGKWTANTALTYQWLRGGKAIAGATGKSYKLVGADAGKKISVRVTGKLKGYTDATKNSKATAKIKKAAKPKIAGKARVGSRLTAKPGSWAKGTKVTYQWYAGGKKIKGATKPTYKLKKAQAGKTVTVKITGKKKGSAAVTVTSAKTRRVK